MPVFILVEDDNSKDDNYEQNYCSYLQFLHDSDMNIQTIDLLFESEIIGQGL